MDMIKATSDSSERQELLKLIQEKEKQSSYKFKQN
jgi:hypothetical protein